MGIGIFFGMCIMSVFAVAAVMLADDGHEKLAVVFCGPAAWLLVGYKKSIEGVKNSIKHRKFRSLLCCPDGQIRHIDLRKVDAMLACEDREYEFVKFSDLNAEITSWPKEYRTTLVDQTVGSMRYRPRAVWEKYEAISDEEYKHAKTHRSM